MTGALAASGLAALATTHSAQAVSGNANLYFQIAPGFMPSPVNAGSNNVSLTVSPSSGTAGTPIEVQISSSTLRMDNGPASSIPAGTVSLDAVVEVGGTDYILRGSATGQDVPANLAVTTTFADIPAPGDPDTHGHPNYAGDNTPYDKPSNFNPGWVISSTAGNSSSTSTVKAGAWTSGALTGTGTGVPVAGTGGTGSFLRSGQNVGAATPLVSSGAVGSDMQVVLKGLVANSGLPAINDNFDQVVNIASTGTRAALLNNTPASYISTAIGNAEFAVAGPAIQINSASSGGTTLPVASPYFVRQGDSINFSSGTNTAWPVGQNVYATACSPGSTTACAPVGAEATLWANGPSAYTFAGGFTGYSTAGGAVPAIDARFDTFSTFSGLNDLVVYTTTVRPAPPGFGGPNANGPTSAGAVSASAPLNFLAAARTAATDDATLVGGSASGVSGTNFYPGETVTVDDNGTSPSSTIVADANGNIDGTYTVTDLTSTTITMTGIGGSATTAAFNVVAGDNCIAQTGNTTGGIGCNITQNITAAVTAGNLSMQAYATGDNLVPTEIGLGSVQTSNTAESLSGDLNSITVTDNRGGTYGWSLTAELNQGHNLNGSISGQIAGSNLTLDTPSCTPAAGSATGVTAAADGAGFGGAVTLCLKDTTTTGNASGTTGGEYVVASGLDLNVPAFQAVGVYTGTLTITLV